MPLILQLAMVFVAACLTTGIWCWLAHQHRWVDHPNTRSSHQIPTPRGGGIGVAAGFLCYLWWDQTLFGAGGCWLLFAGCMLLLTGLLDDLFSLPAGLRLVLQIAAVMAMWPFLSELPALQFGVGVALSGVWLALLASLIMVAWINLFNFMDGIDALAASEAVFLCIGMTLVTALSGGGSADLSALGLGVATSGFLWFNLPRAKIFMGDAGSYFTAFAIAVCGLLQVQRFGLEWWALLILPGTFVVDSMTTLLGRLLARAVWYHPHKTHAYQLLAVLWNSHGLVVVCNASINLLWLLPMALLATRLPSLGPTLLVVAWLPLVVVVVVVRHKHANMHVQD